jgi:hypothetical protein
LRSLPRTLIRGHPELLKKLDSGFRQNDVFLQIGPFLWTDSK